MGGLLLSVWRGQQTFSCFHQSWRSCYKHSFSTFSLSLTHTFSSYCFSISSYSLLENLSFLIPHSHTVDYPFSPDRTSLTLVKPTHTHTHTHINFLNKGNILLTKHCQESEAAAFACLLFNSPLACIVGLSALLLSCCLCVRIFLLIRARTTVGTREIFKVSMTLPVLDIGKYFMLVTQHHYVVKRFHISRIT